MLKAFQIMVALPLYSLGLVCLLLELYSAPPLQQLAWYGLTSVLATALLLTPSIVALTWFLWGALVFIQIIGHAVLF